MFGALKPGFQSLATLELVMNVVGLNRKVQLRHRAASLRQHGFLVKHFHLNPHIRRIILILYLFFSVLIRSPFSLTRSHTCVHFAVLVSKTYHAIILKVQAFSAFALVVSVTGTQPNMEKLKVGRLTF